MILPKLPNTAPKSLTKTNRMKVFVRQNGICPWCGRSLDLDAMHAHHRLLRSNGGTWSLSNILGLHGWCHNVQPASVHQNPERACGLGFMIRKCLLTPLEIPTFDAGSREWRLADDAGDWAFCLPALALELLESAGQLLVDTSAYPHPVAAQLQAAQATIAASRYGECATCGQPYERFDSPTGVFYSHFEHPGDGHDATPPSAASIGQTGAE